MKSHLQFEASAKDGIAVLGMAHTRSTSSLNNLTRIGLEADLASSTRVTCTGADVNQYHTCTRTRRQSVSHLHKDQTSISITPAQGPDVNQYHTCTRTRRQLVSHLYKDQTTISITPAQGPDVYQYHTCTRTTEKVFNSK